MGEKKVSKIPFYSSFVYGDIYMFWKMIPMTIITISNTKTHIGIKCILFSVL